MIEMVLSWRTRLANSMRKMKGTIWIVSFLLQAKSYVSIHHYYSDDIVRGTNINNWSVFGF